MLSLHPDVGKLRHGPMQRAAHGWDWQRDEASCALAHSAGLRIVPAFAASSAACVVPAAWLLQGSQRTLGAC